MSSELAFLKFIVFSSSWRSTSSIIDQNQRLITLIELTFFWFSGKLQLWAISFYPNVGESIRIE
jgi:hypothetical protein